MLEASPIGGMQITVPPLKRCLPGAPSRGRTAGTPSVYKPYCRRDNGNITRALPVAVRRSFPALPWQPVIPGLTTRPAPALAPGSCLDWNDLKRFLVITEAARAGAAGRPPGSLVSAAASNFRNDSRACRLSLGFPEIQGLLQTPTSVCDRSDSGCGLFRGRLGASELGRVRAVKGAKGARQSQLEKDSVPRLRGFLGRGTSGFKAENVNRETRTSWSLNSR